MATGDLITTVMVALFLALFLITLIWAWRHRQLQDIEQIKYAVFEDEDEGCLPKFGADPKMNRSSASSNQRNRQPVTSDQFFQQETTPYQPDRLETGQGAMPAPIRYLPHIIIAWGVGYVLYQAESNFINYAAAALLVLWSGYTLIAVKKQWPPFP